LRAAALGLFDHRLGGVDPDDLEALGGELARHAPRPGSELEDRSAEALGHPEVELDVGTAPAIRLVVVSRVLIVRAAASIERGISAAHRSMPFVASPRSSTRAKTTSRY